MAFKCLLGLLFSLSLLATSYGQVDDTCLDDDGIQDIRLAGGTFGNFMGRVEVRFNGTWGTVCDDFWSFSDADVVCRMLGYEGGVCATRRATFGAGDLTSPIWIDNTICTGNEDCLGNCSFIGLGTRITGCNHFEDAGVVCLSDNITVAPPTNVQLVNSTTSTITIQFEAISVQDLPEGVTNFRYKIVYLLSGTDAVDTITRNQYFYPDTRSNDTEFIATLTRLNRDVTYSIQVGVEYRYFSLCFSYAPAGPLSNPVILKTNATARPSDISVRLVPPQPGVDFMGRVEVLYNGTWGTVCDDSFGSTDSAVICRTQGYAGALCTVLSARIGQGTGQIWLDNLNCPASAEIIEDCTHPGWGVHNCGHRDDAGVICNPGVGYLGTVSNFTVASFKSSTATVQWEPFTFPNIRGTFRLQRLEISYISDGFFSPRSRTILPRVNSYTISGLTVGITYNITIRPRVWFTYCSSTLYGNRSEAVQVTTMEAAPEGPPTNFHAIVLNRTAIEAQWDQPLLSSRNGNVRGYKLFVQPRGGSEREIDIPVNTPLGVSYIIRDLRPRTVYIISVLAYTTSELRGPRSIHLTAQTLSSDPIITRFGVDGSGMDRVVRFTYQRRLVAHCSTGKPNVQIDWFFENGTKVGITDRNLREGHYPNGTTVLQIAVSRRFNPCDGGVYICVANDTVGNVERRNFSLTINTTPQRPSRPVPIKTQSNSITVGWDQPLCDGGHTIVEFDLQYYDSSKSFFDRVTVNVPHIEPSVRNYTATGLEPSTPYQFRVRVLSSDLRNSAFSIVRQITTLPAAPSPPRDVTTRIVAITVIEVRWRVPALPNGVIIRYTVYLSPLSAILGGPTRTKRQAEFEEGASQVIKTVFPGTVTAGNVTVPTTAVRYGVQVTASISVGEEINEGQLSPVTDIFVPEGGLPVPQSVRTKNPTNTSITLLWNYPPPPFKPIEHFLVSYSSQIAWRSPMETLVQFTEYGNVTIDSSKTTVRVSPLTPGTSYQFRLSAITSEGPGEEIGISGETDSPQDDSEKLAFLQVRIGPILSCSSFQRDDVTERLVMFQVGLVNELNRLCSCGLTTANLKDGVFSCANGLVQQVVYRARILGTDNYSSRGLVSLVQSWIDSGHAALNVGSFRFQLDPTCSSYLDSPFSPDCDVGPPTKAPVVRSGPTSGEIGMIIVGLLMSLLLLGLIALIVGLLVKRWRKSSNGSSPSGMVRFTNRNKDEDKAPFADLGDSARNSVVLDSDFEKPLGDL